MSGNQQTNIVSDNEYLKLCVNGLKTARKSGVLRLIGLEKGSPIVEEINNIIQKTKPDFNIKWSEILIEPPINTVDELKTKLQGKAIKLVYISVREMTFGTEKGESYTINYKKNANSVKIKNLLLSNTPQDINQIIDNIHFAGLNDVTFKESIKTFGYIITGRESIEAYNRFVDRINKSPVLPTVLNNDQNYDDPNSAHTYFRDKYFKKPMAILNLLQELILSSSAYSNKIKLMDEESNDDEKSRYSLIKPIRKDLMDEIAKIYNVKFELPEESGIKTKNVEGEKVDYYHNITIVGRENIENFQDITIGLKLLRRFPHPKTNVTLESDITIMGKENFQKAV
jgi:hypothetical protein